MQKRSRGCGLDLPVSEFSKHGNGYQSTCRPCNRIYQKAHYKANKAVYLAKAAVWTAARRRRNVLWLLAYLSNNPCVDCGEKDPIVLQFDHVRGVKAHQVSDMLSNGTSWAKILEEIGKCDIRCANCHWRRHARLWGWRKTFLALAGVADEVADDGTLTVHDVMQPTRGWQAGRYD